MQYDVIIMDLMTRVIQLEKEVENLKKDTASVQVPVAFEEDVTSMEERRNLKMTDGMIDVCYEAGKSLYKGESLDVLVEEVVRKTGMNRNSVIMYLYAIKAMLTGEIFKRAISAKALRKYLSVIFQEYGKKGLKRALAAIKAHIVYRESCGHKVNSLAALCAEFEGNL